jgi:hypothetical protein
VYNIEVEGDHCYRVGVQGLLVHNMSDPTTTTPPPSCCITSVELLTSKGQNAGLGVTFPPIIAGGVASQTDPNILGPVNNPSGALTGAEYRYSLMILWRGSNLHLCTFRRWVSRNIYGANRKLVPPAKGRGWLGATGEAHSSDADDTGLSVYIHIDPAGKFAIQSDVPGGMSLKAAFFRYEYLANFYAAALSGNDVKGEIWYNLEIVVDTLNDPNPTNGPPYVVRKNPP